jgi:hypothetical protein
MSLPGNETSLMVTNESAILVGEFYGREYLDHLSLIWWIIFCAKKNKKKRSLKWVQLARYYVNRQVLGGVLTNRLFAHKVETVFKN